jgi:peptide deformylase
MALRTIVTEGDEILRKKSKEVKNFGERTHDLLDDMWETMREADGVGLAAPQVGVLRRAVVIDVTAPGRDEDDDASPTAEGAPQREDEARSGADAEGADSGAEGGVDAEGAVSKPAADLPVNAPGGTLYELLNPEIIASEGELREREGCLSVPGLSGFVRRPARVTVKALTRDGEEISVEGRGMLAKALCHEIDHLDGILFTDIAEEITSMEAAADESARRAEDE